MFVRYPLQTVRDIFQRYQTLFGFFLISCAVLFFETLLPPYLLFLRTHVFMLMVLGVVFLGIGIGSMASERLSPSVCCWGIAISIVSFLIISLATSPKWGQTWNLLIYNLTLCIPFLFFGALISQVLSSSRSIGMTYAIHISGCALGVLFGVFLLERIGFERCLFTIVCISLISAICFRESVSRWSKGFHAFLVFYAVVGPLPQMVPLAVRIGCPEHKPLFEKEIVSSIRYTRWDPIARIDVGLHLGETFFSLMVKLLVTLLVPMILEDALVLSSSILNRRFLSLEQEEVLTSTQLRVFRIRSQELRSVQARLGL